MIAQPADTRTCLQNTGIKTTDQHIIIEKLLEEI